MRTLVAATLGLLVWWTPPPLHAQSTALTPEESEAQQMGLEMAFACSPRRHGLATGSTHTIEGEPAPLSGTAVYFASIEGMFVALEEYDDQLDGHCLVFGWWGDTLVPGTYGVSRLAMSVMEREEMSGEHSFFSWGAIRATGQMSMVLVESGTLTIDSFASGAITGSFELTGFVLEGDAKGSAMTWRGTFSGVAGEPS